MRAIKRLQIQLKKFGLFSCLSDVEAKVKHLTKHQNVKTAIPIENRSLQVGDSWIVTEVLELSSNSQRPYYTVVLFPGNPSVLPYYRSFMEHTHQGLGGQCAIHAISHTGFGDKDYNGGKLFNIDHQVDIKISYIDELIAADRSRRLILMGHSLGAYVMMQVLKQRPDLPVDFIVPLFPVFCNLEVSLPIQIMQVPIVRESLSFLLSTLPESIKHAVVSMIPSIRSEARMLTEYFHSGTIRNALYLTRDELENITELDEKEIKVLKRYEYSSLYLYTTRDPYVKPAVYHKLRELLPDATSHLYNDVEHSFVIQDSHTVAERVCVSLSAFLLTQGSISSNNSFSSTPHTRV